MATYIITAEGKEEFDVNGKSLGVGEKRAVFYATKIGRRRLYRNYLANPAPGLRLLTYRSMKRAQEVCDRTNEIDGGNEFKVEVL
jgi:hypothetical protein